MMARWTRWGLLVLFVHACAHTAPPRSPPALSLPQTSWSREKQALHLLHRLAFGPSPADFEEVMQRGPGAWIAQQLQPASVPDYAVDGKLQYFRPLQMSTAELLAAYPAPMAVAKAEGVKLQTADEKKAFAAQLDPLSRPRQMELELQGARLVRAVESKRQLEEVLDDFWFNHFNVSSDKGPVKWMVASYDRDALRPHLFGRFRELLGAVAHHPAMLFYLDNWLSARDGLERRRAGQGPAGLNENYARELLELHTLGVDGGYTQGDVREVARCFTGWSIDRPRQGGTFVFHPRAHDPGEKVVLGQRIPAGGGLDDGERVLDLLASHPSTARFIARKLAQRFVADEPPPRLVDRLARVFLDSGGDLRSVYLALFRSEEFWSDAAYEGKTKTPLELAVSALRALGGTTVGDVALSEAIGRMGEPLFRCQPPTGYPEVARPWVNPGALVTRINFGLALATGRIHGTAVSLPTDFTEPRPATEVVDVLAREILHGPLSQATRAAILRTLGAEGDPAQSGSRPVDARVVAGLLLGTPEFQKR